MKAILLKEHGGIEGFSVEDSRKFRADGNQPLSDFKVDRIDTRCSDLDQDVAWFYFRLRYFLDAKKFGAAVLGQYDGFHALGYLEPSCLRASHESVFRRRGRERPDRLHRSGENFAPHRGK